MTLEQLRNLLNNFEPDYTQYERTEEERKRQHPHESQYRYESYYDVSDSRRPVMGVYFWNSGGAVILDMSYVPSYTEAEKFVIVRDNVGSPNYVYNTEEILGFAKSLDAALVIATLMDS